MDSSEKSFEKTLDPLELIDILRKNIRSTEVVENNHIRFRGAKREIILSGYMIAEKGK